MVMKQIVQKIKKLDKKNQIAFIMLFGSRSKNLARKDSDIDIAIFFEGDRRERFKFRMLVSGSFSNLDVHIFQDLPLRVQKEVLGGELLYYKDYDFVIMEAMKVIREFNSFEKYYNIYLDGLEAAV